jgi:hypothetical protein
MTLFVIFDAAPVDAEMVRLHHHRQPVWFHAGDQQIGQLHDGLFLDLRPGQDPLRQARIFRQADQVGVLVRHDADPEPSDDGAEVMAAGAANGDGSDDHQLVEAGGVGKFGHRRTRRVAAVKHLVEVHLGHPAGGILGVVVAVGVDHQAFEHQRHFAGHFLQQLLEFAGFDEVRDVVVGVKAAPGRLQSGADALRGRRPEIDDRVL